MFVHWVERGWGQVREAVEGMLSPPMARNPRKHTHTHTHSGQIHPLPSKSIHNWITSHTSMAPSSSSHHFPPVPVQSPINHYSLCPPEGMLAHLREVTTLLY